MEYNYTSAWSGYAEREAVVDKFFSKLNKMIDEAIADYQNKISKTLNSDNESFYTYCYRLVKFTEWKKYLNDNRKTIFFHYCEGHPKDDKYLWIIESDELEMLTEDISIVKQCLIGYDTDLQISMGRTENFSELFVPLLSKIAYDKHKSES